MGKLIMFYLKSISEFTIQICHVTQKQFLKYLQYPGQENNNNNNGNKQ